MSALPPTADITALMPHCSKMHCRLGITDATFGRSRVFCRNASEHQPYIVISIYLDCRVQKDLLQNVPLRITAADLGHSVEDGFHEIDDTGVFTSPMR